MGQFRVTVEAVGNHGCRRDEHRKDPMSVVVGCGQPYCTDCITREYVKRLQASGASVSEATIHHWPGTNGGDSEVVDNLITMRRIGSF